jgi:hypothetical protein
MKLTCRLRTQGSPEAGGRPGRIIIWCPFEHQKNFKEQAYQGIFFKVFLPRAGLAKFLRVRFQIGDNFRRISFVCGNLTLAGGAVCGTKQPNSGLDRLIVEFLDHTPVAEACAYTTHNNNKIRTFMHTVGLESAIPAIERLQTYDLDSTATWIAKPEAASTVLPIFPLTSQCSL